jgi:hypothetical protein
VSELYRPSDRRLSAKLMPTFAGRGCRVVNAADPHSRILVITFKKWFYICLKQNVRLDIALTFITVCSLIECFLSRFFFSGFLAPYASRPGLHATALLQRTLWQLLQMWIWMIYNLEQSAKLIRLQTHRLVTHFDMRLSVLSAIYLYVIIFKGIVTRPVAPESSFLL